MDKDHLQGDAKHKPFAPNSKNPNHSTNHMGLLHMPLGLGSDQKGTSAKKPGNSSGTGNPKYLSGNGIGALESSSVVLGGRTGAAAGLALPLAAGLAAAGLALPLAAGLAAAGFFVIEAAGRFILPAGRCKALELDAFTIAKTQIQGSQVERTFQTNLGQASGTRVNNNDVSKLLFSMCQGTPIYVTPIHTNRFALAMPSPKPLTNPDEN